MVGIQIFKFPPLCIGPGYVHIKFDFNLYSFTMPFGQSAVGVGKKVAPSRVVGKTKPKKWVKYYKVCNFIAELLFRNVGEGFKIKLFKNTFCSYLNYARRAVYAPELPLVSSNINIFCFYSKYIHIYM